MASITTSHPAPTPEHVEISFDAMAKVVRFVSAPNITHPLIDGVYIEPHKDGAILVATDGHRLVVYLDTACKGLDQPRIIRPSPEARKAMRLKPRKSESPTIRIHGDVAVLTHRGASYSMPALPDGAEGTYPPWRQVIPSGPYHSGGAGCAINYRYVNEFTEVFSTDKHDLGLYWSEDSDNPGIPGPLCPVMCLTANDTCFYGVIMPIRVPLPDPFKPSWLG